MKKKYHTLINIYYLSVEVNYTILKSCKELIIIYSRGSEWRKWDLHIHSNASDGNMSPKEIIDKALELEIKVIALTDHHTAKNIDEAVSIGNENGIVVIPGVEFRTEYGERSVHMIGLFPYKYNGIALDSKGLYDAILTPLGLSDAEIIKAGREHNHKKELNDSQAFKEGLCRVQVDFKNAADLIHKNGGLVSVHAGSKDNGLDEEMKHEGKLEKNVQDLYDSLGTVKSDLFKRGYIDICEVRNSKDSCDFYWNNFGKVSILASDAHSINEVGRKFSWIKADPCFEGLKQILLENQRIFLGDKPDVLNRLSLNSSKYISKLYINKKDGYKDKNQRWFENVEIPINGELVSIIGNKGSGKSAIADIIGLLLDSDHYEDFQFLNKDRFLKKGFGDNFYASLKLYSNHKTDDIYLTKKVSNDEPVKVRYLPQHYFETLCNEVGKVNKFRDEIESVVYQYLRESDKLGKSSFKDFIRFKSENIDKEITFIKNKLEQLNNDIIILESKNSDSYKSKIKNEIKNLESQIKATQESKPEQVPNLSEGILDESNKKIKNELYSLLSSQKKLAKNIEEKKEILSQKKIDIERIKQLRTLILNKYFELQDFLKEIEPHATDYEIDLTQVIKSDLNVSSIDSKIAILKKEISSIEDEIGDSHEESSEFSLAKKQLELSSKIENLKNNLSSSEQKYQNYLKSLKDWKISMDNLIGSIDQVGSLKYFEHEIKYLNDILPDEINSLIKERIEISKKIFSKKLEIKNIYDGIKAELDSKLTSLDKLGIEIVSKFNFENDYERSFLSLISKKRSGSYYGNENSRNTLRNYVLGSNDIDNEDSLVNYLNRVMESLEYDLRDANLDNPSKTNAEDIIIDKQKFYSYIFSLDYLTPRYELIQNEKTLDELSPGEKGALLLVFYLALDKTDIPIIIDQPEDNLDNHSVTKVLIPFIREAKKHRQIIMVTHNPNLAIVADAEQIIHVNIDKAAGNKFEYISGSIENPRINEKIVDVLEGTMPAFNTRKNKYHTMIN